MENRLEVKEISKNYGDVHALNHLTLVLEPGIYGLVGNNGAGKSTLLNILTTVIEPTSGGVLYNDKSISKNKRYRRALGYVPQLMELPKHITCEQYLYYIASLKRLNKKEAKEKIEHLFIRLNLEDKKHAIASNLSGGQRQRLLIAQSLLNDPKVLLLDEPTAGLDPIERKKLREFIIEISKGKIIVIATHIISDIEYISHQVIFLEKGNLLECASQSELIKKVNVYESLMSRDVYEQFSQDHSIVNTSIYEDRILVRHFDASIPGRKVNTKLEDVYLYELSI